MVFFCGFCHRQDGSKLSFPSQALLREHNLRHHPVSGRPKPHPCPTCELRFNTEWEVDQHQRSCLKIQAKKFACEFCPSRFTTNKARLLHLRRSKCQEGARQVAPDPDPEDPEDPDVYVCPGNCPGPFKMAGKEIPAYGHFGCAPTLREYKKLMVPRIGVPESEIRFYQAPTFQHPAPQVKCPRPAGNVLGQFDHPERFLVVIKYTLVHLYN